MPTESKQFNFSTTTIDHFVGRACEVTTDKLIEEVMYFVEHDCCEEEDWNMDVYEALMHIIIKKVTLKVIQK